MKFALIMTRKYESSDRTWSRAFGPFDNRGKARTFIKKQIRHIKSEYLWNEGKIAENFSWKIVQLWGTDAMPYKEDNNAAGEN